MGRHVIRLRHHQCYYLVGKQQGRFERASDDDITFSSGQAQISLAATEWLFSDNKGATGIAVVEWLWPRRPVTSLQYEK